MSIFNLHTPARCNLTADEDNHESFASACTDPVLRRLFMIMVNKFQVRTFIGACTSLEVSFYDSISFFHSLDN